MKTKFKTLIILSVCSLFFSACSEKELLSEDISSNVVQLTMTGNSTDSLEYVMDNKVIITAGGSFEKKMVIGFDSEQKEILIRKKSSGTVLQTKVVAAAPFDQTIRVYYDGVKAYDKRILLTLKGYAISGELEFLVGGSVLHTGTGAITKENLEVLIDENSTREFQVRKKGETAVLLSKNITSTPERQTLNFFFDGTNIVDNVKLDPPANPANMMVRAKFETSFPNQFKMVDVDLVFYTRLKTESNTTVGTKVMPEIRFTLSKDGSFNSIELPPLPGPEYMYSFDIYEKGTNSEPYNPGTPLTLKGYTIKPNEGRITSAFADNGFNFQAGASKLFLITDGRTIAPAKSVYVSGGKLTDLSQYFKIE